MGKLVNAPIRVITAANGVPERFLWKHRWLQIESIEEVWPLTGQWWNGEPQKMFWRVKAGTRLFEICELHTCPVSKRPQTSGQTAIGDEQVVKRQEVLGCPVPSVPRTSQQAAHAATGCGQAEKCGHEWQLYKIY